MVKEEKNLTQFSPDETLITEEERQRMFADVYPVEKSSGLNKEESYTEVIFYAPKGRFTNKKYKPPSIKREDWLTALNEEAVSTKYRDYGLIENESVTHSSQLNCINWYSNQFIKAFHLFLDVYGKDKLLVRNGFNSPEEFGITPHSTGVAIDLITENEEQSLRIMNAAFKVGIPTIIPAGNTDDGTGHVHLDLAPKANYIYDAGIYNGPWSV